MLPSGVMVRLERDVTAAGMVQRGIMPSELRSLALQFSGAGVSISTLSEEELASYRRMELVYITQLVLAFKPPKGKWTPFRLTIEELEADPPKIPSVDLEALQDIVRRRRTLRQVDAVSRLQHELITPEEASKIVDEEFLKTIVAWRSFRDQLGIGEPGAGGEVLGNEAEPAPVDSGSGHRPRRRRSRRAKSDGHQAAESAA